MAKMQIKMRIKRGLNANEMSLKNTQKDG